MLLLFRVIPSTGHTHTHTNSALASQSNPHGAFMEPQPFRIVATLLVSHSQDNVNDDL